MGDLSDQAAALAAALPEACRPDAVVARPLEAMKLAMAIHECQQAASEGDEAGAGLGISLAELLIELKRRRSNEVLELRAAGVCTAIHLRDGDPIFAEGGSLQETLGRQLVRRGAIAHDDYVRVVARMTEGVIQHQSLRLGEVLVELGLLSPAEVYDALALQVREKIVACFQWESFDYELHESLDESEDLGIYQCPPAEALVLAGDPRALRPRAAGGRSSSRRRRSIPRRSARARGVAGAGVPADGGRAEAAARDRRDAHGGRARGGAASSTRCTPGSCWRRSPSAGCAVAFRKTPLPAREKAKPPPPVARPRKAATARGALVPGQVGARRHPRSRRPRPAAAARPLRPARRSCAGAWASRPRRRRADPRQARLEAENAFNQGLRLLRESLLPGALREFRHAVALAPQEPEYRLLEAWLEYRSEKSGDARALAASKVRACAQLVLQASRTSARAHSVMGQLALQEGDEEGAEKHLRVALRYDEHDVETSRCLRILEKRGRS